MTRVGSESHTFNEPDPDTDWRGLFGVFFWDRRTGSLCPLLGVVSTTRGSDPCLCEDDDSQGIVGVLVVSLEPHVCSLSPLRVKEGDDTPERGPTIPRLEESSGTSHVLVSGLSTLTVAYQSVLFGSLPSDRGTRSGRGLEWVRPVGLRSRGFTVLCVSETPSWSSSGEWS